MVSHDNDLEYSNQDTEIVLSWTAIDDYADTYEIAIDNEVVATGLWTNNTVITHSWTPGVGTYEITVSLYDSSGNTASVEFTVTVTEDGTISSDNQNAGTGSPSWLLP